MNTIIAVSRNNMDIVTTTREFNTEFGKLELKDLDSDMLSFGELSFNLSKISHKWMEEINRAVKIEMNNLVKAGHMKYWGKSGVSIYPQLNINFNDNCKIYAFFQDNEDEDKVGTALVPYEIPLTDGLKFAIAGYILEDIVSRGQENN